MNVSSILTKDYENIANWTLGENKPNLSRRSLCCKSAEAGRSRIKPSASSFTEPGPNSLMLFLLFTLFDIPNMIYTIRKNIRSITRILSKEPMFSGGLLEKKMEV
jgi:hypothetical protein